MRPFSSPRFDPVAHLRMVSGALAIGAFPLLALGHEARLLGSRAYAALALTAFLLLLAAILWPAPRRVPRPGLRRPRRPANGGEHHA